MKHLIQQHKQHLDIGSYLTYSAQLQILESLMPVDHNRECRILLEETSTLSLQHAGDPDMKSERFRDYVKNITTNVIGEIMHKGDHSRSNRWQNGTTKQALKMYRLLVVQNIQARFSKNYSDTSISSIATPVVLLAEMINRYSTELRRIGGNIVAKEQQNALHHSVYDCELTAFIPKKEVFNA